MSYAARVAKFPETVPKDIEQPRATAAHLPQSTNLPARRASTAAGIQFLPLPDADLID